MIKRVASCLSVIAVLAALSTPAWSAPIVESGVRQVEQYNFSIHILAMLLVGFGFLMVFVKKYGYSATTGTYLVVGAGIPALPVPALAGALSAEPVAPDTSRRCCSPSSPAPRR